MDRGNHSGDLLHGVGRTGNFTVENSGRAGGLRRVPPAGRTKPVVAGAVCGVDLCCIGRGGNLVWLCRPAANLHGPVPGHGVAIVATDSFRTTTLDAGPAGLVP